jgi:2-hydroxy-6-oxonona-2,4-dienedioate hydrolase
VPDPHRVDMPPFSWDLSARTNGIAHRAAGQQRDFVLIHGLGMSSAYFDRFARALYARGAHPIAPDLPGFGESVVSPAVGAAEHAKILAEWTDVLSIRDATWIGHSLGCNAVASLARLRPDIVKRAICIGPLWSPRPPARLLPALIVDSFREPLALYPYVARAYLKSGVRRWVATARCYAGDIRTAPPDVELFAGERDPLVDRKAMPNLTLLPGAHACHFSHPDECANAIVR